MFVTILYGIFYIRKYVFEFFYVKQRTCHIWICENFVREFESEFTDNS